MQEYREIGQSGLVDKIFKFVFLGCGFMTFWLTGYWLEASEPQLRTGIMGTTVILVFWALGAGVTGFLIMIMKRGPKTLVQPRTGTEATKNMR